MTINDILSHRYSVREFYATLRPSTITDAAKEPLKLGALKNMARPVTLPTKNMVDYGTALCFVCLQSLLSKFSRRIKPDDGSIEYMAQQMMNHFPHWTVLDLPTFVNMCVMARIPSIKYGMEEYELLNLDIPSILGKAEVYDKMRPNPQALQGGSPIRRDEKPLTQYQLTHKIGGIEYKWPSYQECWRYWKGELNKDDPDEKNFYDSVNGKRGEVGRKVS